MTADDRDRLRRLAAAASRPLLVTRSGPGGWTVTADVLRVDEMAEMVAAETDRRRRERERREQERRTVRWRWA